VSATVLRDKPREATGATVEAIYRKRHRELMRVATAITGSADLGAEAVQEGLARALARKSTFRGSGSLEGWLWKVVVNAARNLATRTPPLAESAHDDPGPANEPNDDAAIVRQRLAQLPERQRLVLFLRYYADLDYAGIACILKIRRGTVAATLSQAQAVLRPLLSEEVHR
jgi:RNA polymerase sigma-70 factor (ECF subfamily)